MSEKRVHFGTVSYNDDNEKEKQENSEEEEDL